jgi:imidazole glycerol phosphate synthase subunit HisF
MRVGAIVLLINGKCFQSYGWSRMRPLGELQHVIDMLEEYECDDIAIVRPVREFDTHDLLMKDIDVVRNIKSLTPISFGGGLRSIEGLNEINNMPVERLVFSSAFLNKDDIILQHAVNLFGHQAIQCLLPIKMNKQGWQIYICEKNKYISIYDVDFEFINKFANEVVLYDTVNEGGRDSFQNKIFNIPFIQKKRIVISGGIGYETINIARTNQCASVLIDNKILHQEYSISRYKSK